MLTPEDFWTRVGAHQSGPPSFATIEGDTMYLAPQDSTDLKIAYYQRLTPMTADGDVDWVLTNAPHVYLHGALAELYGFEDSGEQRDAQTALFNGAVNALDASEEDAALSGSALVMRPAVVV
jgi:hypothetical protein